MTVELPPARDIPVTWGASFKTWWAAGEKEGAAAEERILRKLPFYVPNDAPPPSPPPPAIARSSRVQLSKKGHYINTLSILPSNSSRRKDDRPDPVILLHGYGAGLGFFFRNFPSLGRWVSETGGDVYSLDWLGMGRSARVPFRIKASRSNVAARVSEAESFFVDSLEEWRDKMGIERMSLVAHSLGAYLSVAYALRYPEHVSGLVLLSPAGVPHDPTTTQPAREITDEHAPPGEGGVPTEDAAAIKRVKAEQRARQRNESTFAKIATHLWEGGYSPFGVIRGMAWWGPLMVGRYTSRRFGLLDEEERKALNAYVLSVTLAKGSGEYCISHLLAPWAHARMPLVDRIDKIKVPVSFLYGDTDWMDPDGGKESVQRLKQAGNKQARVYIVPMAGHHVYLDNAPAVDSLIIKELDRIRRLRP